MAVGPMYDLSCMSSTAQAIITSGNDQGIHLFPHCDLQHWWLMIVDVSGRKIYSMDSFRDREYSFKAVSLCSLLKIGLTKRVDSAHVRQSYSREEWNNTIPYFNDWSYEKLNLPSHLRQGDFSSCGVFVCLFCAHFLREGRNALNDLSGINFPSDCANDYRGFIFTVIMRMGEVYNETSN